PCNQNALEKKPPFAYSPPKNRAKGASSRIQGLAFESTVQQKYKTNTGESVEIIYTFPVACSPIYAFEDCDGVFIDECDFQIPTFSRKLTDLDLSPRQAAAAWVQAVCRATSIAQCVEMISPKKTMTNVSCYVAEVARSGNLSEHQVWGIFFDWLLETLYKECHFDRHAKRVLDKAMLDITQESILTVKQQLTQKYPHIAENSWNAA
ncbi:hypothetical protein LJC46_06035, partial [Desulfovibrio sp. OttesenSCG-928-G15]|nr:hypothetical protein [Desulfovibrio sp. OttesenSCG-928-G15]